MSEFERVKHTIGSHTVLVTSWFDDSAQTWRASAPDYSFLSDLITEAHGTFGSRKAAIDKLSNLLEGYLTNRNKASKK